MLRAESQKERVSNGRDSCAGVKAGYCSAKCTCLVEKTRHVLNRRHRAVMAVAQDHSLARQRLPEVEFRLIKPSLLLERHPQVVESREPLVLGHPMKLF